MTLANRADCGHSSLLFLLAFLACFSSLLFSLAFLACFSRLLFLLAFLACFSCLFFLLVFLACFSCLLCLIFARFLEARTVVVPGNQAPEDGPRRGHACEHFDDHFDDHFAVLEDATTRQPFVMHALRLVVLALWLPASVCAIL